MTEIKSFEFNPFMENTYVLWDETNECIIIDPGCYEKHEEQELVSFIEGHDLKVKSIINTHCHIDHVLGNSFTKEKFKAPLLIPKLEESLLMAVKSYAPNYGFHLYHEASSDGFIDAHDSFTFGNQNLKILFVPGHSPGHIALYHEDDKFIIGGDVLFENSIGRTDLPGGNYETLIKSIREKFFTLPDDVIVYCGHGSQTSIGFEKRTNPFCAIA